MGNLSIWQIIIILGVVLLCLFSSEWWLVALCGVLWFFWQKKDGAEKSQKPTPFRANSEQLHSKWKIYSRSNETAAGTPKKKVSEKTIWAWMFAIVVLVIWVVIPASIVSITSSDHPKSSIESSDMGITPEAAARRQKQLEDVRRAQIAYTEKRAREEKARAKKEEAQKKREQERKAALENMERRRSGQDCINVWNGSHSYLVRQIKPLLREPDSFEHISTRVWKANGGWHRVTMQYRAKNGFGGMSIGEVAAEYESGNCGNIRVNSMR